MHWPKSRHRSPKALLVFPRGRGDTTSDAVFPFPFLGLTQIAAGLPSHFEIRIRDERIAPIRRHETADIVFISALTQNVMRAYELADGFRRRNVPVVLGGIHPTVFPREAAEHADAVVTGEAENLIADLAADFENRRLQPLYHCQTPPDLDDIPVPALHLLTRRHRFFLAPIQTSRGCPYSCNFCSVPANFGRRLRLKSMETLDRELQALTRLRPRNLFVVDDNFTADRDRAAAIMDLFRYYGFRWMGFANLSVSEDETFLRRLGRSRCVSLFIGIETLLNRERLLKNRAFADPAAMEAAVARIHAHGIGIQGSFIFGFDEDTPDVFLKTVRFIQQAGIELPNINILTPLPGTPLFESLQRQGRLLHTDWSRYDMSHLVFQPAGMSAAELQQGFAWALKYLASPTSILRRLRKRYGPRAYFLIANFALHRSQTRLAHDLWQAEIQDQMQRQGLCPC